MQSKAAAQRVWMDASADRATRRALPAPLQRVERAGTHKLLLRFGGEPLHHVRCALGAPVGPTSSWERSSKPTFDASAAP